MLIHGRSDIDMVARRHLLGVNVTDSDLLVWLWSNECQCLFYLTRGKKLISMKLIFFLIFFGCAAWHTGILVL